MALTATCHRDGAYWLVEVPGLAHVGRASRLCQVEGVARGLLTEHGEPGPAEVTVDILVPEHLSALLQQAVAARCGADEVAPTAVARRREVARALVREGLTVRDVAWLLGVSYARAAQLVGDRRGAVPDARRGRSLAAAG